MKLTKPRPRMASGRRRRGLDPCTSDLLAEVHRCHGRIDELTAQRDRAVEGHAKLERDMRVFERNYRTVLAENRELHKLIKDPAPRAWNPLTEMFECGACGWTLEDEPCYCPNCGAPVDCAAGAPSGDPDWEYDRWRDGRLR